MALEKERAYVAEKEARLVSYNDNQELFRRELVRYWPAEPDNVVKAAIAYLNTYGSANNTVASQFVVDPIAGSPNVLNTYSGTWRVVKNEKASKSNEAQWPGISGIVQTLRYGFAQTAVWDEARIVNNERLPGNTSGVTPVGGSLIPDTTSDQPSNVIVVEFVNLDPAYTPNIVAGFVGGTGSVLSGFTIRGILYSDTYHVISATVGESPLEDGSGIVRLVLAQPQYTLNAYDQFLTIQGTTRQGIVHYLWNVPRDLAQTIINAWKATRREASASLNADNTVNIVLRELSIDDTPIRLLGVATGYNCSLLETTYYYWGVKDPTSNAYDITSEYYWPNAGDPGYTMSKNVSFKSSDGLFDIVITERHISPRAPYTETTVRKSTLREDLETLKLNQTTAPAKLTDPTAIGTIETIGIRINDDCSIDSTLNKIISTQNVSVVEYTAADGKFYDGVYQNWASTPTAAKDDFIAATAINVAYYNIGMDHRRNEDGTYDLQFSARPVPGYLSVGVTLSDVTWWEVNYREFRFPDSDEQEDEVWDYEGHYVEEYTHHAIKYFRIPNYSEDEVYTAISGLGGSVSVGIVGDYYRVHLIIGKKLASSADRRKPMMVGIGDLTGTPDTNPPPPSP